MTPEKKNADISEEFVNDDYLPQEPELKQALGEYRLVQSRVPLLSHDASALIDAYSQEVYPA